MKLLFLIDRQMLETLGKAANPQTREAVTKHSLIFLIENELK